MFLYCQRFTKPIIIPIMTTQNPLFINDIVSHISRNKSYIIYTCNPVHKNIYGITSIDHILNKSNFCTWCVMCLPLCQHTPEYNEYNINRSKYIARVEFLYEVCQMFCNCVSIHTSFFLLTIYNEYICIIREYVIILFVKDNCRININMI